VVLFSDISYKQVDLLKGWYAMMADIEEIGLCAGGAREGEI